MPDKIQPDLSKPFCHRFMIPHSVVFQEPNPLNPKEIKTGFQGEMSFVRCLGAQCALWDNSEFQCGDLTQAKALRLLASGKRTLGVV